MVVARPAHQLAQVDARPLELDLPARDARHVEQVVDEPGEVLGLTADDLLRARGLLAAGQRAVEEVDAVADRRERVAQLVREDAEELVLAPVRLAQRLLGALALGDVHHVTVPEDAPVRLRRRHRPPLDPAHPLRRVLVAELVVPARHRTGGLGEDLAHAREVVGVHVGQQRGEVVREHLPRDPVEVLGRGRGERHARGTIGPEPVRTDDAGHARRDLRELILQRALLLGHLRLALAGGDVERLERVLVRASLEHSVEAELVRVHRLHGLRCLPRDVSSGDQDPGTVLQRDRRELPLPPHLATEYALSVAREVHGLPALRSLE